MTQINQQVWSVLLDSPVDATKLFMFCFINKN